MTFDDLGPVLESHGQEHVLQYWDELDNEERTNLVEQLASIEWKNFDSWLENYVLNEPEFSLPGDLEPAPFYPLKPKTEEQSTRYRDAVERGWELLRGGKVAAFTVAGGQGTRLGFDGPKGTFPIAPITGKTLFQIFAESIQRWSERGGQVIPWYIMTSPMNDGPTREFFNEHDYFGLSRDNVMFFPQGVMPAFNFKGKLLLAERDSLALSPDGHGGSLKALYRSGAIADMGSRGVEHISYFQVDNPLVSIVSPWFLGLHDLDGSEMSSRCLPKTNPFEKIGVFCRSEGRIRIVEYSDLPDELATQTDAEGNLRFLAGSPAIHLIRRDFVERLNSGGDFQLPFHRAVKKVSYLDAEGEHVEPDEPNAVKLETFVFDALPLAKTSIVVEADRHDEFAPVKNADGVDSVESCRTLMQERFARWLAYHGIEVPRTVENKLACRIEISPKVYVTEEDFAAAELDDLQVGPGSDVLID